MKLIDKFPFLQVLGLVHNDDTTNNNLWLQTFLKACCFLEDKGSSMD